MNDMVTMREAFAKEMLRGQAAGRPAWQQHLTFEQKLDADRLMNAFALSRTDEALKKWYDFRSRYADD